MPSGRRKKLWYNAVTGPERSFRAAVLGEPFYQKIDARRMIFLSALRNRPELVSFLLCCAIWWCSAGMVDNEGILRSRWAPSMTANGCMLWLLERASFLNNVFLL